MKNTAPFFLKRERNREFQTWVKKLEADPACGRQNLKSFLVLPFQRITRIKLLLEVTDGKVTRSRTYLPIGDK